MDNKDLRGPVLVTGGAGAIGSRLTRRLLDEGFNVVVLDDLSSGKRHLVDKRANLIEGSINHEASVDLALKSKPQTIFHLAALFANQNSVDHPIEDLVVNAKGTLELLEKSRKQGIEKFIYFSSSCVYGQQDEMDEQGTLFLPDTPYAISKLTAEKYCTYFAEHFDFPVFILRLFNNYGPGEMPGAYRNVIPNFIHRALEQKPLHITGTGKESRSFLYVEDTIEAVLRIARSDLKPGAVFNVCGKEETSILELAQMILHQTGSLSEIVYEPRRGWDKVVRRRGIFGKLHHELGFVPQTSMTQGLKKTIEWIRHETQKDSSSHLRLSTDCCT